MRILLLGEYSNVHATLAEGLRTLGHQVTVASNGDFWKDYPRDIDLSRRPGKLGGISLMARLGGFDIVQLINPMFLELKAARIAPVYRYLRRHNRAMVMGAMGMDYYWVSECTRNMPLRYSDFNLGHQLRTDECALREQHDWIGTDKERLNRLIATDSDAIVAGLYEYHVCYEPHFPHKLHYIPLPVKSQPAQPAMHTPLRVFIGISRGRSQYKGTDIMLRAAEDVAARHPEDMQLVKVEGVPFDSYRQLMEGSDILLDQLYSYTPSMNTLLAMSKGIVCLSGGEPEGYAILNEDRLRPIVNVLPTYQSVVDKLEELLAHPERLPRLKAESIEFVGRHHDYLRVAKQYEELYQLVLFNRKK